MVHCAALPQWKRGLRQANGPSRIWSNAVASKQDYLDRLQVAVQRLHGCGAVHTATVPVHEVFQGKTVWEGDVEVFDLHGHPKAKRVYAWSHIDGPNDENERFVAVLEVPPVDSAQRAVQVQIVKDAFAAARKKHVPRRMA